MSVRKATELHCDTCGEWDRAYLSFQEAWPSWESRGWRKIRAGRLKHHMCPKCASDWRNREKQHNKKGGGA